MSHILILGAGRSAYSLIHYLLEHSEAHSWSVCLADQSVEFLNQHFADHPNLIKKAFNVLDEEQRRQIVQEADVVISMLPARFHPLVAQACLHAEKHLLTASYISKEMQEMQEEIEAKGLLFLNEMGLDPGIDHLSAMQIIDRLKAKGATFKSFKSYTGGLVAPESDNNPWNYKFTWNPRNVVLAGQGIAKYIEKGQYKYLPYHRLFKQTDAFEIDGFGEFEGYPNRDSLQYRGVYGLNEIPTMLRGTFRRTGYCQSWDHFVQLGITDDSYTLSNSHELTYRAFINTFLPYSPTQDLEQKLAKFLGIPEKGEDMKKIEWLGLLGDKAIGLHNASPAQILQQCLEEKWTLAKEDKDMIVMLHQFEYELEGHTHQLTSSLVILGEDSRNTGMAKGVGLPLAIATKLLLTGKLQRRGLCYPTTADIYEPVLAELEGLGVNFSETEEVLAKVY